MPNPMLRTPPPPGAANSAATPRDGDNQPPRTDNDPQLDTPVTDTSPTDTASSSGNGGGDTGGSSGGASNTEESSVTGSTTTEEEATPPPPPANSGSTAPLVEYRDPQDSEDHYSFDEVKEFNSAYWRNQVMNKLVDAQTILVTLDADSSTDVIQWCAQTRREIERTFESYSKEMLTRAGRASIDNQRAKEKVIRDELKRYRAKAKLVVCKINDKLMAATQQNLGISTAQGALSLAREPDEDDDATEEEAAVNPDEDGEFRTDNGSVDDLGR